MKKDYHALRNARIRLQPGEIRATNAQSRYSLAVRSQQEVAAILGITRQRVQQIERYALWKIRTALTRFWREFKSPNSQL